MQYPKGDLNPHSCNSQRILSPSCLPFHHSGSLRAKNGTRTRDPNLGKVVLYQLSYFRNCECKDKMLFCFCKITARKSNGKFCLRLYRPMEGNYVRDYKLTYFTAYSSTNIERLLFVSIMPFHGTGQVEQLKGELQGFWSRRIDKGSRLVYKIDEDIVTVFVISMKGHYGDK